MTNHQAVTSIFIKNIVTAQRMLRPESSCSRLAFLTLLNLMLDW